MLRFYGGLLIVATVLTMVMIASPAVADTILFEDRAYIDTDTGGVDHGFLLVIPDHEGAWQFACSPNVNGFDFGLRLPRIDWGEFKVQPRSVLLFRDGQDLPNLKLQTMTAGAPGYWLNSVVLSESHRARYYEELGWDIVSGKHTTFSVIGCLAGEFSQYTKPTLQVGPALTWHLRDKADLQVYYGFGVASASDVSWLQVDFYIPTS